MVFGLDLASALSLANGPPTRQNLAPGASALSANRCALVIESAPNDLKSINGLGGRLPFESFPGEIDEGYGVGSYDKFGGKNMAAPTRVTYRGGDWNDFSLSLKFFAANEAGNPVDPLRMTREDVDSILVSLERRARWCQALAFPLSHTPMSIKRAVSSAARSTVAKKIFTADQLASIAKTAAGTEVEVPPAVLIVFGSFLTIRGYVSSVSLKWGPPWHPTTVRPYSCDVNISFIRVSTEMPDYESIMRGVGRSGMSPDSAQVNGFSAVQYDEAKAKTAQRTKDNAAGGFSSATAAQIG